MYQHKFQGGLHRVMLLVVFQCFTVQVAQASESVCALSDGTFNVTATTAGLWADARYGHHLGQQHRPQYGADRQPHGHHHRICGEDHRCHRFGAAAGHPHGAGDVDERLHAGPDRAGDAGRCHYPDYRGLPFCGGGCCRAAADAAAG
eukprot:6365764-Prymnesium_polylepis.2